MAGCLLGAEALFWIAAGVLVGAIGSVTAELAAVVSVTLGFLTLVTIFLLVRAPRGGVWMGLLLQVAMLAAAIVFLIMWSLAVVVPVAFAVVNALALAAAWPGRRPE